MAKVGFLDSGPGGEGSGVLSENVDFNDYNKGM
jgi:hypothetical protein